jgi:hypothetical protein
MRRAPGVPSQRAPIWRSVTGATGVTTHSGVNVDPALQPEEKLRALNSQPYINWVGLVLHHDDLTDD